MTSPETRPSLILKLKSQRDQAAWQRFAETYESFLQSLVRRRGVPAAHVPDVCQLILSAIARSISRWDDDGDPASFRRWVSTVARNVSLKYMAVERRHIRATGGTDAIELLASQPDENDDRLNQQLDYELVIWAAGRVRSEFIESSWKAFWATVVEGRDVQEVAEELSVSRGSIYMSRSRIMRRLKDIVAEVEQ